MDQPAGTAGPEARIEPFLSPPFEQWAYVVRREGRADALVVDPGFRTDQLLSHLEEHGLSVAAILLTHGHSDHIAGVAAVKAAHPDAPIVVGRGEAHLLTDPDANLSRPFGAAFTSPPADRLVDDGEVLELAGFRFEVREIPGHSPGSVVYVAVDERPPFVIGGDVLFAGSIGRFDFPGGDGRRLVAGIRSKLFHLPDPTKLYPGHGPPTTIGAERLHNPYAGERSELFKLD